MEKTLKFYSNYKDGRFFISAKNEEGKWYSLWKSKNFNNDLYLDNAKFKGGLEIEKTKLKLLDDEEGCKILVFRNENEEAKYCISKKEIEKRKLEKKNRVSSSSEIGMIELYIKDLFKELFEKNSNLKMGDLIKNAIEQLNKTPDETTLIEDDNLPF